MKILVFDNYDSFTYNLVHYLEIASNNATIDIYRNDQIPLNAIEQYDKIVLSPGPGLPKDAGILLDVIKTYAPTKSILGVCLGHQAIGEAFGASLLNLNEVFHGVATPVELINEDLLFKNIPMQFNVGRYHSWVINKDTLPSELIVTCIDSSENIMAIKHKNYNLRGVQFHPESVLTEFGQQLITNWFLQS